MCKLDCGMQVDLAVWLAGLHFDEQAVMRVATAVVRVQAASSMPHPEVQRRLHNLGALPAFRPHLVYGLFTKRATMVRCCRLARQYQAAEKATCGRRSTWLFWSCQDDPQGWRASAEFVMCASTSWHGGHQSLVLLCMKQVPWW